MKRLSIAEILLSFIVPIKIESKYLLSVRSSRLYKKRINQQVMMVFRQDISIKRVLTINDTKYRADEV